MFMNFNWNADTIRWYQEAEHYTGFFQNISHLLAPRLKGYATLCDIGCGVGLLGMALSEYVGQVTCIDINAAAIEALQKSIKEKEITNLTPCLMDGNAVNQSWDVICHSFFGGFDLEKYLHRCKKIIAIVGKRNYSELMPDQYRRFPKVTVEETEQLLLKAGIQYSLTEASFEFGQPFVSLEDARKFIMVRSPNISLEEVSDFLTQRLVETGKKQYPFYMPRMKPIGIFEIKGEL